MIRWIANQKGTNYSSGAERSKCNKFDFVSSKLVIGLVEVLREIFVCVPLMSVKSK